MNNYKLHKLFTKDMDLLDYPYLFNAFSFMTIKQIKYNLSKQDYIYKDSRKDYLIMNLIYSIKRKFNEINMKDNYTELDYLASDYFKLPNITLDFLEDYYYLCNNELINLTLADFPEDEIDRYKSDFNGFSKYDEDDDVEM